MTDTFSRSLLTTELIRDEGCMLRAYKDTATPPCWTIGVGRNLDAIGIRPIEHSQFGLTRQLAIDNGITKAEAMAMLENDIEDCECALNQRLPWWKTLSDVRQRVLLNMTYQLGISGLLKFKTMLAAVQKGAWASAAAAMRSSLWAQQAPNRAARLAHMMETGVAL